MEPKQFKLLTELGTIYLVTMNNQIIELNFESNEDVSISDKLSELAGRTMEQLNEYATGKRCDFDLPLNLMGTNFQQDVWSELIKIPFGETISYFELANRLNAPKAVRAVGGANGKNPIPIIVPCHRVIAKDGSLGGYSGGLDWKRKLLKIESRA